MTRWQPDMWSRGGLQTHLVRRALIELGVSLESFEAAYGHARHEVFVKRGRARWKKRALLTTIFATGCMTRVAPAPMPCDLIADRPGLHEEMVRLKKLPGDPFKFTRWYALDADAACAGDRVLGAAHITPPPPVVPWYKRAWRWVVGCFR